MKKRLLIVAAAVVVCVLGAFLYMRLARGTRFPDILPVNSTIAYVMFSTAFENAPEVRILLSDRLKVDWDKDVAPWIVDDAAIVFLKNPDPKAKDAVLTLVLAHARSLDKAPSGTSVALIGDTVVMSATKDAVDFLLKSQSPLTSYLSNDANFNEVHKGVTAPYFAYINPALIPKTGLGTLSNLAGVWPQWPFIDGLPAIGVSAWKVGKNWQGTSYVALKTPLTLEPEQA